jgi:hypothetical protein
MLPHTEPRRSSYPPPVDLLDRDREGPLHLGWQRVRAAMRSAGAVPGLFDGVLHGRLGPNARLRPTPRAIVELLDGYLRAEPDGGHYLSVRESDGETARQIVGRLRAAVPELGPLTLVDESHAGRGTLVLRTAGAHAAIDADEIGIDETRTGRTVWIKRSVTVRAIVDATNALLERLDVPMRMLAIEAPDGVEAFLGVDERGAALLDAVAFWETPVAETGEFPHSRAA